MAESNRQSKEKKDDEDRALRNAAARLQIDASKKVVSDQALLQQAAQPVAMTQGANGALLPPTMDNRDVGLPENAALPSGGLQQGGYNVAGKQFTDPAAAQAAVSAANTPDATNTRILAAQRGIDPVKAITLQKDIAGAKVADVQAADAVFKNNLGQAMRGGHDGLAKLVSDSTSDGMGGYQLRAVFSADAKKATYNKVGADGTLTLTSLTFDNNETGLIQAARMLDQTVTPAQRLDYALKLTKETREGKEGDSRINLQNEQTRLVDAAPGLKDATDPNAPRGSAQPMGKRMSEIDKATFSNITKQREQINSAMIVLPRLCGAGSLDMHDVRLRLHDEGGEWLADEYRSGALPMHHNRSMRKHLSETTGPQRLSYGLAGGLLTLAIPLPADWAVRGLLGWCVGVCIYLALAWWLCVDFDSERTRTRAQAQDEPSVVLLLILLLATMACVAAITALMQESRGLTGMARGFHIGLTMFALAMSWLFIQTIFAFRYAHRYYQEEKQDEPDGPGLQFPGGLDPDYFDFLYYSHVVGMTSQVSDVQVTSREMRRLTLLHGVLSFAFNMLIVALSINVVAGLLQ